jgi:hypothetical protein
MPWRFAMPAAIGGNGRLFVGSPGSGIQRAQIACTGDSDCDGLSNSFELSINTDPGDADSDDDGLTDGEEVAYDGDISSYDPIADTDPLDEDSDDDKISDGIEVAYPSDPLNPGSYPLPGDLNVDGAVNTGDIVLLQRIALGLQEPVAAQSVIGDVAPLYNNVSMPDGLLNTADVLVIIRKVQGLAN